jgi:hypothetical protein
MDSSKYSKLIEQITVDNEQPVPKEALDMLTSVVVHGADGVLREVATLLANRLNNQSISVKLKALRVIMVLATQGGPRFATFLRLHALDAMQTHAEFEASLDPIHGEKPKLMIRAAAVKCMRTIEEQPQERAATRTETFGLNTLAGALRKLEAARKRETDACDARFQKLENIVGTEDRISGLEVWLADVEDKVLAQADHREPGGAASEDTALANSVGELQYAVTKTNTDMAALSHKVEDSIVQFESTARQAVATTNSDMAALGHKLEDSIAQFESTVGQAADDVPARILAAQKSADEKCERLGEDIDALEKVLVNKYDAMLADVTAGSNRALADSLAAAARLQGRVTEIGQKLETVSESCGVTDSRLKLLAVTVASIGQSQLPPSDGLAQPGEEATSDLHRKLDLLEQKATIRIDGAGDQIKDLKENVNSIRQAVEALSSRPSVEIDHVVELEAQGKTLLGQVESLENHVKQEQAKLERQLLAAGEVSVGRTEFEQFEASHGERIDVLESKCLQLKADLVEKTEALVAQRAADRASQESEAVIMSASETAGLRSEFQGVLAANEALDARLNDTNARITKTLEDSRACGDQVNQMCADVQSVDEKIAELATRCSAELESNRELANKTHHALSILRGSEMKAAIEEGAQSAISAAVDGKLDGERFEHLSTEMSQRVDGLHAQLQQLEPADMLLARVTAVESNTKEAVDAVQKQLTFIRTTLKKLQESKNDEDIMQQIDSHALLHTERLQLLQTRADSMDALQKSTDDRLTAELAQATAVCRLNFQVVCQQQASEREQREQLVSDCQGGLEANVLEIKDEIAAGQDASQQRIDALEAWLLQVEESASAVGDIATRLSNVESGEAAQALKTELGASIAAVDEDHKQLLRKVATGIKSSMEATESKVLQLLQQHVGLFDDKVAQYDARIDQISTALQARLKLAVTRTELQTVLDENVTRGEALEEKVMAGFREAEGKLIAAESSVAEIQAEWQSRNDSEEKQQEPLSIRVTEAEVRDDSGKPYVIYRFEVRFKGAVHVYHQRWSACENFHKAITKDLKLPKGAEFKAKFPMKKTKMKNFEQVLQLLVLS